MPVFKGTKSFYEYEVSDALAYNVKTWLDHGLLETGAFTIVSFSNVATSGLTNLQRVQDERYGGTGRVYEGMGNWVWEPNIAVVQDNLPQPLVASGVRVNNVFYPTTTTSGTYAHKIDFRDGRVIFNTALPANAQVKCEYTFRDVATYLVDDPQWRTIIEGYTEKFEKLGSVSPSGMAQYLKDERVWLPAVVIEVGDRTNTALQLGGGDINTFDVNYHIFSDKSFSNRRLCDLLNNQFETTLPLFNLKTVPFPYTYEGTVASGALTYPTMSDRNGPYFWDFAFIAATDGGPRTSATNVYRAEISHTISVDRHMSTF
jgi:hypothetical protein